MIAKLVSFVIALAVMSAAASVLVVSGAFAFYALLRTYVGPAGAAACLTLAAAIVLAGVAFVMLRKAKGPRVKENGKGVDGTSGLVERLTGLVNERPVVAASAAVAAGLLAWRNPMLVSTVLKMMEPRAADRKRA